MGVVRVRLLGDFSVDIDGLNVTAASFERRSGADLVALLALSPQRRRHREQVLDALWPDAERGAAMNRLNKAATYARQALGVREAIVVRDDVLALLPEHDVWVDAIAVRHHDSDDDALAAAAAGELLPDLPYDEWTVEARNELLLRQIELLRAAGRWEAVLVLDPTDESAHIALMRQSLARGDADAVARRFAVLERTLDEQLGVVPSPAAVAIRDQAAAGAEAGSAMRTFVVTDLAGSTDPASAAPDQGADQQADLTLHEQYGEIVSSAMIEHGGVPFTGPAHGVCAAFTSVAAAVRASVEAQRRLQTTEWPGARPRMRIGIDTGEARQREGGWYGRPVDRTTRIMDAGSGDQILCSPVVAEMASDVGDGVEFVDLGLYRLADVAPLTLWRVTAPDLEVAAAPPRSMRVGGRPIPPLRTHTFGREVERAELGGELQRARIVTLVGPGGAGKTHLALHVGADLADRFTGGAWLCQLGTLDSDGAAGQEILTAIGGLQHATATVADSIVSTLGERDALLLVDNCEHVRDGVAPLIDQILAECPRVRVLATSRAPLGSAGEVVRRIHPLERAAAIELFVSEARRHGQPIDAADPAVSRICARLDDLPLAVRLAAARARSIDLPTLESLLADRFEFLTDAEPGGLEHQQTLRTTIAWSVNALDRPVREFLTALSVFADRFDMNDIGAMSDASPLERIAMVDELTQRSLLIGPEPSELGPRYRLLESVRLFTRERLTDAVRHRYVDHLVALVDVWRETIGAPDNDGVRRFADRWDDLRAAVFMAAQLERRTDVIELLSRSGLYGNVAMRFEMLEWYDQLLDVGTTSYTSDQEARAYAGWAVLANFHGDWALSDRLSHAVAEAEPELAEAAWAVAWRRYTDGDLDDARMWLDRIIDNPAPEAVQAKFGAMHTRSTMDFADDHDLRDVAHLLDVLSADLGASARSLALGTRALSRMWTDGEGAIADADACIELSDRFGLVNSSMTGRSIRAFAMVAHGTLDRALDAMIQVEAFASERGLWHWALSGLGTAGALFERAERPDAAVTVLGARDAAGYRAGFSAKYALLQADRLRREYPDDFARWWDHGQRLGPADVAAYTIATASGLLDARSPVAL